MFHHALLSFLLVLALSDGPGVAQAPDTLASTDEASATPEQGLVFDFSRVPLRVLAEYDEGIEGIVAPPPGYYFFHVGDRVLLHAYSQGDTPARLHWQGDGEASDNFCYVTMDGPKTVTVSFRRATDALPATENAPTPYFEAGEDHSLYAFMGGEKLYGWMAARRSLDHGAGITHLVHADFPWFPAFQSHNLNLEHIFSGAAAHAEKALFAPRLSGMAFRMEGPGAARVRWPARQSPWPLDCEMLYQFTDGEAIDLEFSVTPRDDDFPLGHVVFMWATYLNNVIHREIYFPGIRDGKQGWVTYGGNTSIDVDGTGCVAFEGTPSLPFEKGATLFNLLESKNLFFSEPFYYGLTGSDTSPPSAHTRMAYIMMFDQDAPIRFAVWNWGAGEHHSAWDWQYVVRRPEPGKQYRYRARMVYQPFESRDRIRDLYLEWRNGIPQTPASSHFPELPMYWSPTDRFLDPLMLGKDCLDIYPDYALAALRLAMHSPWARQIAAEQLTQMYIVRNDIEGLVEEWRSLSQHHELGPIPDLQLAKAQLMADDHAAALESLKTLYDLHPENLMISWLYGDTLYQHGMTLLEKQEYDQALDHINRAMLLPVPAKLDWAVAFAHKLGEKAKDAAAAGNIETALDWFEKLSELDPSNLWHFVFRAELLTQKGDITSAKRLYQYVLNQFPESPYSAYHLDQLLKQSPAPDRVSLWRELAEKYPEAVVPALYLGHALRESGDVEAALDVYRRILGTHPDHPQANVWTGRALIASGEANTGVSLIRKALADDPECGPDAAVGFAEAGRVLKAEKKHSEAAALYRDATALVPAETSYHLGLAEALEASGNAAEAARAYQQLLNIDPEHLYGAHRLHVLLKTHKTPEEQRETWYTLRASHPQAITPALFHAHALRHAGQIGEARSICREILERHPDHAPAMLCAAIAALQQGDWHEGGRLLKSAVAMDASLRQEAARACIELGDAWKNENRLNDAAHCYRYALELMPQDLSYHVRLGDLFEMQGRYEEALEHYQAVIDALPDSPQTAEKIDRVYEKLGDAPGRHAFWRRMSEKYPDAEIPRRHSASAYPVPAKQ